MIDNKATDMIKTVTDIIEEAKNEMCIDYCKYQNKCYEKLYNGGEFYCTLDKL